MNEIIWLVIGVVTLSVVAGLLQPSKKKKLEDLKELRIQPLRNLRILDLIVPLLHADLTK